MKGFPLLITVVASILISCSKEGANTVEPIINKAPTYTVTIEAGEGGAVSTSGGSFTKDSQVSVTATPDAEYLFESWSDGSTDNPRTIKVGADLTITANFIKKQYDLTITVVGEGSVLEQVMVQGGRYNSGSQIKLTATATEGWAFINWSGAIESVENPSTISVNGDLEITATFLEDADGDGIPNTTDQCPDTPSGEQVDENGCSDSQKDTDEDGVTDDLDQCPDTPSGDAIDENGCADSQRDSDGDGVPDLIDLDNSTRQGVPVDENGIMLNPIFLDENGVTIKAREWGEIGDVGTVDNVDYKIIDSDELKSIISNASTVFNYKPYNFCTSRITSLDGVRLSYLPKLLIEDFKLSTWDVSKVTDMTSMFKESTFNGDISNWDVSKVTDMTSMFKESTFNGDISNWDVSKVTDMTSMFEGSTFNGDISNWDVSRVQKMINMFKESTFNGDISNWNLTDIWNMSGMFRNSTFNQSLNGWKLTNNARNGITMESMFEGSAFNSDVSSWNVSNVRNMSRMFKDTPFNQDISNWNPRSLFSDMSEMFKNTPFNQDISGWNVWNVQYMRGMFENTPFNQDLSSWQPRNVRTTAFMFSNSAFNQEISEWNHYSVEDMEGMFKNSSFNQDISSWETPYATNMRDMFYGNEEFNQDLSSWNVEKVTRCEGFSEGAASWTLPKPNFTNCDPN